MLEFKSCNQNDINNLFNLSKDLIYTYENLNYIDIEKVLSWINNKINNDITNYLQIIYENKHVGYIHIIDGKEVELDDFYIFEEYQNQGIGTRVLRHFLNEIKKPIFLYVFIKNTKAISLYKKLGFTIIKQIKDSRYIMRRN